MNSAELEAVRRRLSVLTSPVRVVSFTQAFGASESVEVTGRIVKELTTLNELISVEEVSFVLDKPRAEALGIDRVPAIALMRGDEDARMRFLGAPSGYEFLSLVEAIALCGTSDSGLSEASKELVARIDTPTDIRVFVTPTCPHCPRAVTLSNRIAAENRLVTTTCVDASEFIDLSRRFHVTGVPKTVVNESIEILGALPEEEFVSAVLGVFKPGSETF